MPLTPPQFIAKWKAAELKERAACQAHFLDLCGVLGQPTPPAADPTGEWFTFEKGVVKDGGGQGFADVWRKGFFGWEYKGKKKSLKDAYAQLCRYKESLLNPPLLVVCDLDCFEVHTHFPNTAKEVHAFDLDGLADPKNLAVLRAAFANPDHLKPGRTQKQVTVAVVTDCDGLPLAFAADAADVGEVHLAELAVRGVQVPVAWDTPLLADKGFDSDGLRAELAGCGYRLLARHRRNRRKKSSNDGRRLRRLRRR